MLYCATHKDEDLNALRGEKLDALTEHMVVHKSSLFSALTAVSEKYVIWEMVKKDDGYYFGDLVKRPTREVS